MKVQTSKLRRLALDWAVAMALEFKPAKWEKTNWGRQLVPAPERTYSGMLIDENGTSLTLRNFVPSSNWHQGGQIIHSELIHFWKDDASDDWLAEKQFVDTGARDYDAGSTPLEAAMRCFVFHKLGAEVEIPVELAGPG